MTQASDQIGKNVIDTPLSNAGDKLVTAIIVILVGVVLFLAIRSIIRRVSKRSAGINTRFIWQIMQLLIIIVCLFNILELYFPQLNPASLLIRGSALVVAIVGFAAQPAISDLICGLLISIHKPFEIGNRIVVEGQEPGIVEDITLRHTVVRLYDGIRIIVPNSQLNSKVITNTSYKSDRKGIHMKFSVSYDTDVQKAMDVIRDCVVESPYTLGVENNGIMEDSGPVYFLQFADSALILETTIFTKPTLNTYTAITDVNMRVNKAFRRHGIEIPYGYLNVIGKEDKPLTAEPEGNKSADHLPATPSKRHHRTDTIRLSGGNSSIEPAMEAARRFAARQRLGRSDSMQLQLLSEESIGIIRRILENAKAAFWIEGSGQTYRIHIQLPVSVDSGEYKKLVALSSSGRNDGANGLNAKIWSIMMHGIGQLKSDDKTDMMWSMREERKDIKEDEIAESVLTSFADDIRVLMTKTSVEFVVEKSPE